MTSVDIRQTFLTFFKERQHDIVVSAPLVVKNDPSLLFVNSGMAPFKEFFLGNGKPKNNRIADTQKCLRVSGKHNDLEEVGKDTYHHTMFEMLGNWSFGDYFKKEAITWAWELLTEVYKINKDDLYVTIFEGSSDNDKLPLDKEAFDIWKTIVPENRILKGSKSDNFWEMGDQGPCGPASEIHVDIRSAADKKKIPGKDLVNKDHPQVVEIWNLVFMEYNRKANGALEVLPAKHIDTGMGFERLCMVLQGVTSNYDTDVFKPLIREIGELTNFKYGKSQAIDIAMRVIADHVRAVAFAIADGQLPSNTGAGYVIRRILRRAIRYGFTFLDQKEPFIYRIIATLSKQMGAYFTELSAQELLITNVIKEEEQSFLRTLDQGLLLLDSVLEQQDGNVIAGSKAFELFDTYGFPLDLTQLIASERGFKVDVDQFNAEMKQQKDRSRSAAVKVTDDWTVLLDQPLQTFANFDVLDAEVKIARYRKVSSKKDGDAYQLVFNNTPFYPEGGGQIGDSGTLTSPNGDITFISTTKKENNLIIHTSKTLPKVLDLSFKASVNKNLRNLSACNHTATHLLHQALRTVLGTHVEQKGSLVKPKSLRFDFSHFSKLSKEQLQDVEDFVNARIRSHIPLQEFKDISIDVAKDKGALALFGEKYGDKVRVIQFGNSIELCGGTHVKNTNALWHFKIINETAVASGVRRIEAITNEAVSAYFQTVDKNYTTILKTLKIPADADANSAVKAIQQENAQLKKDIEQLQQDKAKQVKQDLKAEVEIVNGVNALIKKIDLDAATIKSLVFELGSDIDDVFILLGSENDGKAILTCYISKSLIESKHLNAGKLVRELGKHIQGGGGGQAHFATAGGQHINGIKAALTAAYQYLK